MKIPVAIVTIFLSAVLAVEAWTLTTLTDLKADVAAIKAQLETKNSLTEK